MIHSAALEVDIDAALVLLGRVLQSQLATHLLDAGLDLLHVSARVVALADNDMQVGFAALARSPQPLLEDVFSLLNEQAVEIDRVGGDATLRVVRAEDVVPRLAVVVVHLRGVMLALFAQLFGARAVARLVGLVCAVEAGGALGGFLPGEVAKAVILGFCVIGGVVEGCRVVSGMWVGNWADVPRNAFSYRESPAASFL